MNAGRLLHCNSLGIYFQVNLASSTVHTKSVTDIMVIKGTAESLVEQECVEK